MEKEANFGNEKEWFRNHLAQQQPQQQQWDWQAQYPTTEYGYQHPAAGGVYSDPYAHHVIPAGKCSKNFVINTG